MTDTIYRVTLQAISENTSVFNGIDAALNVNINDYKECYVMVERLLGASMDVAHNTLKLDLQGILNNIGVSNSPADLTLPSHVGHYRGVQGIINAEVQPKMLYDYECFTQNWMKVSLSTIGNIVLTTNFDLSAGKTSTLYVILKFKFVK